MKIFNFSDMSGGWFVGNFTPTTFATPGFEVAYKKHPKGEQWDVHYHKKATEINLLIKGSMMIQDTLILPGQVFVLEPYEIADPVFLEDCELVVVKTPSVVADKHSVKPM